MTLSIRNKITLLASICVVAVVGLLAWLSQEQQRNDMQSIAGMSGDLLRMAAQDTLKAQGQAQSLQIQLRLDKALSSRRESPGMPFICVTKRGAI